jgi:hypothetical protein
MAEEILDGVPAALGMGGSDADKKGPDYDSYTFYHQMMAMNSFFPFPDDSCSSYLTCCIPRILCHTCIFFSWSCVIFNKCSEPDVKKREPYSEPLWPVDTFRWTKAGKEASKMVAENAAENAVGTVADQMSAPGTEVGEIAQA